MASLPRGTVTFLFTDIEGSTRLLDRLGAAGYSEVLAAHDSLLRQAFERHGGREVGTEGDAFFVAFGRAGDAVRAAVDAQRALHDRAWPDRIEVRVRIGLHTGEPAVGGERYVGMGVHRAARISAVGHGGQILVSSATRELIADDLPSGALLVDLGEYQLKDLDRAERVYQVLVDGLPAQFPPLKAPSVGGASPFVGREREHAELAAALELALAGSGRLVLVAGEAGIGKSRLADEFAATAQGRGARVLWGGCWESGGAPAYWPWVRSLRSYVRDAEPDHVRSAVGKGAADLVQMLPELHELFPDLHELPPSNPEGARFRLFDSTVSFLRAAASSRALVLILDDLHAADTPSLLLLEFVARESAGAPLLILGLYRDVELHRDHPLTATLGELKRIPSTVMVAVSGLTEQGAAELIGATAGRDVPEAVVAAIHAETEGNPLFVAEVVRLLASEDRLDDIGDSGGRAIALPESVREVIGHRLHRLSRECADLLGVVSVLGREFSLDAVERLGDGPTEDLLDLLDEAVAARVVAEVRGSLGRFRFAHALVRDALYEELTPLRRIRLHRRAGEALESLYAHEPHEHLAELAYHFFEAAPGGDVGKAIDYLLRAGDRAVGITAYEEAARLYGMGLDVCELGSAGDQMLRCRLLLRQGEAHARAGDSGAAKTAFLRVADIARQLGSAEALGEAALGYGGRFVWEAARGDPHLVPLLEEALAVVPEQQAALRARLLARLAGGPLRDDVDRERRDALSRDALELARGLGDPATLAYVLDGRYSAVWGPDNLEQRLELAEELVAAATEAGDKERTLQGHHYRALALLEAGDVRGVYAELEAKEKLVEELRQPAQRWYLVSVYATLATFEGRLREAEELIDEAFALGERSQGSMASIYRAVHLHALRTLQGRLAEHEEAVRRAAAEFPTYAVLRCVHAHVLGELGDEGASALLDGLAADDFASMPPNEEWIFGLCLLVEVTDALGATEHARTLYQLLLPYASRNAVSAPDSCLGAVSRSLGVLAAMLGRWDESTGQFDHAIAMNERTGGRPWLARTQCDYASALLRSGRAGDSERAAELISAASTVAREVGANGLLQRAEKLQKL